MVLKAGKKGRVACINMISTHRRHCDVAFYSRCQDAASSTRSKICFFLKANKLKMASSSFRMNHIWFGKTFLLEVSTPITSITQTTKTS